LPDEHRARGARSIRPAAIFYAIANDLKFLKVQPARIPSRRELARTALGVIFCFAALVILWMEFFTR
jgi:hypothetical protein